MSLTLERRGATALLTLRRPAALNAINAEVLHLLDQALASLEGDASCRAVILTGEGERAFAAGADIAAMASLGAEEAERFAARGQAVLDRLARLPQPVIAAVSGFALGGGCELAMACDIVLAGPKAKFGQPEVNLGVIPGFGGTQRLVRRVGPAVALDLCLTGRLIDADEALRIGLVSRKVEAPLEAALALADELATKGPVAVRYAKQAVHRGLEAPLDVAQAFERALFGLCFATADQREGMAAFLEKRRATFRGA
jgi:enoyl-CoA hydratase